MKLYTIGHSTRSAGEFSEILTEAAVELVVDVRAFPSSRRHPHFNAGALAQWLPEAGIAYLPMPGLGGRRKPRPGSPNGGWRQAASQGYADYTATADFSAALSGLETEAEQRPTSIMCAEAVWWRCHRRLIADALVVRGWSVEHLGIGGSRALHHLPEFAVAEPGGTVVYPLAQGSLL